MLVNGNKIKMIKALPEFDKVGDVFEVSNVSEDGSITIKSSYGVGIMSYREFEEHFELVKEYKWIKLSDEYKKIDMHDIQTLYKMSLAVLNEIEMQTDEEYFMKLRFGKIKVTSYLHPDDEFDLTKGIKICICRINEIMNKAILESLTR